MSETQYESARAKDRGRERENARERDGEWTGG